MSGLVTAGVLLCGVHIANAQTNIDTGYTITIPSEVGIDKDSGKGSFFIPLRNPYENFSTENCGYGM